MPPNPRLRHLFTATVFQTYSQSPFSIENFFWSSPDLPDGSTVPVNRADSKASAPGVVAAMSMPKIACSDFSHPVLRTCRNLPLIIIEGLRDSQHRADFFMRNPGTGVQSCCNFKRNAWKPCHSAYVPLPLPLEDHFSIENICLYSRGVVQGEAAMTGRGKTSPKAHQSSKFSMPALKENLSDRNDTSRATRRSPQHHGKCGGGQKPRSMMLLHPVRASAAMLRVQTCGHAKTRHKSRDG